MVLLWSDNPRYQNAASAAEYVDDKDDDEFPRPKGFLCCRQKITAAIHDEWLKDAGFSDEELTFLLRLGFRRKIGKTFKNRKGMTMCSVLHGARAQDPDHKQWMTKSSFEIYESRYVAISYKHMHWVRENRDSNGHRFPKMPVAEAKEVLDTMDHPDLDKRYTRYWHDGAKPRWNNTNVSCGRGLYPYLLDGGYVLVVPPMCREAIPDPTTWVSQEYLAAREAFAECVRYKFVQKSNGRTYLVRRHRPGVPSVAWGSMQRVWMLAESFCGCLHGRIGFTIGGQARMEDFIREIQTVILMVEFLLEKRVEVLLEDRPGKTPIWQASLTDRKMQLTQLKFMLKDVLNYYMMVTQSAANRTDLTLSKYFLERMAYAGATNHSDRIVVGSMCAMMLQQVFGRKLPVDTAIRRYEEANDPLAFAVMVASSGNHAIPLGATSQQVVSSCIAAGLRAHNSHYSVWQPGALLSQWPQPMLGRSYAGTLTTSPWKTIFWHALRHNRGLGAEHDKEKQHSDRVKRSVRYKQQEAKTEAARSSHFRTRSFVSRRGSRVGKHVDGSGSHRDLLHDATHPDALVYVPLNDNDMLRNELSREMLQKRQDGLRDVKAAWNASQKALVPVIGELLPLLVDEVAGIIALYVMDVRGMEGYARGLLESAARPLVVSEVGENVIQLAKEHDGRHPEIDFVQHPLLQIVLNQPGRGEQGYLIAMRRVWNPTLAGGMPTTPSDLRKQKRTMDHVDAKALLEAQGIEDDWIFPARIVRDRLADYSQMSEFEAWHVPEFVSQYHETGSHFERDPERWQQRWADIEGALATTWDAEIEPKREKEPQQAQEPNTFERAEGAGEGAHSSMGHTEPVGRGATKLSADNSITENTETEHTMNDT